jgi:ribose/xylose/arabinose/galactoside ABC-type transport system permease subunit
MTSPAEPLTLPMSSKPRFRMRREYGLLLLFIGVMLLLSTSVEFFFTQRNLLLVLRDQAHLGVLAVGMTYVILTGGIDLSVGSMTALSAVAMGLVWQKTGSGPAALAAALAVGALCGACNGLLVSRGRVPALIVTLATLSVFRGLAFAIGGSESIGGFPPGVLAWSRADFLGLPVPLWLIAGLLLGGAIYLGRTDGGRAIYAVGSNAAAAALSGVPVSLLKLRVYLCSGLLAGLAAILYAARNDSVKADVGMEYELLAITMVVLGGTSVSGGEGSMAGTALAFLTLIFIQRGITLMQWPGEYHGVVVAALLISALLLDASFRRFAQARK